MSSSDSVTIKIHSLMGLGESPAFGLWISFPDLRVILFIHAVLVSLWFASLHQGYYYIDKKFLGSVHVIIIQRSL